MNTCSALTNLGVTVQSFNEPFGPRFNFVTLYYLVQVNADIRGGASIKPMPSNRLEAFTASLNVVHVCGLFDCARTRFAMCKSALATP